MFGIGLASMMAGSQESSKAIPPATISFGQLVTARLSRASAFATTTWKIVVGMLVLDGAVNLEHPAGEAAVEIKVLEPLPGVARHHLQRNIQGDMETM